MVAVAIEEVVVVVTWNHCSNTHNEKIVAYVEANGLDVEWVAETHVHADHLTVSG